MNSVGRDGKESSWGERFRSFGLNETTSKRAIKFIVVDGSARYFLVTKESRSVARV